MKVRFATAALLVLASASLFARDSRKELAIDLKFTPQEGVHASSPDLEPGVLERSVRVVVEDGRGGEDALIIGKGTNDEDQSFPIRASMPVLPYLAATAQQVASDWGVKTADAAERVLTLRFTRFDIEESNKALGSMYAAEVKLTFALADGKGKTLAEGATSGSAHRYGRARSADNANEVLSDAVKEALANALSDSRLQTAWASGKAAPGTVKDKQPAESVEQRLKKLDDLLKKGLITKDEYDRKRAEILKDL
jgi:ribosomal protein S20